jgi:hypothetical protein
MDIGRLIDQSNFQSASSLFTMSRIGASANHTNRSATSILYFPCLSQHSPSPAAKRDHSDSSQAQLISRFRSAGVIQSTTAGRHNLQFYARTKQIDIQYHFIRECIEKEQLVLEYRATEEMLADALTKGLARDRHWKLLGEMGLQKCNTIKEK